MPHFYDSGNTMYTLYDILHGNYKDASALPAYPTEDDLLHSIHDHLQRLLSARCGVLQHQPDYGLPELDRVYQGLPHSETTLVHQLQRMIEKYEPRLTQVQVFTVSGASQDAVLRLGIRGEIGSGVRVEFFSHFQGSGKVRVSQPIREQA
ncbi:type VI secretion system baseplate subunit TssE [Aliidiomarina soli]|uniref:Type VI secretion system baseplate subunit TssE n=1 Tax=Aliidiomarina soli TaxID=1928574 RepID=A0A432WJ17_9GAMM|nr:type VI secretion system baseplate subunit TssE [Aliidiomarina soli]RUO33745.1 type VI secretion system baseplate subunit TssE [Aliidiomarina soli]